MIIQVDKVKTNEKDLMTLFSSPETQKNMVERVLIARRLREEDGEGENSKFQPWEVQEDDTEDDTEPLCGGTLFSAWTCFVDKGSEKDSESFSLRLPRRTETFALRFPRLAGPS